MSTGIAQANGIELAYETFGDAAQPALLLVMGLGAQMTMWDDEFCGMLAGHGFHVIRYDNRDVGLSTKMEDAPAPDMMAALSGDSSSASYTLDEMADDGMGLLDALGVAKAHIVGASMGGMIVQAMAIRHPERVLSMCSIMSTTGNREVGQPSPEAIAVLMAPPPTTREDVIEAAVTATRTIGSPGFPFDEARARAYAERAYDRMYYPIGTARQMLAITASGDRTEGLRKLSIPTVVIHGEADILVTPSGGRATAEAIPGAKLVTVPGMGHEIPIAAQGQVVDEIVANAARA